MLGFRELIILAIAFAFLVGVLTILGYVVWKVARKTSSPEARLVKLGELRASGKISPAEYERQRASIISRV